MSKKYKHSEEVRRAWQDVKEARASGDREKAKLMESIRRKMIATDKLVHEYNATRSQQPETQ